MFEYQLLDLRRTVTKLLLRARPPLTVYIEEPHAVYLRLSYDPASGDKIRTPNRRVPEGTKRLPRLVEVRFDQLYKNLKGAKGVENNDSENSGQGS